MSMGGIRAKQETKVMVNDDFPVMIPTNMLYSTNKNEINHDRELVVLKTAKNQIYKNSFGDGVYSLSAPFNAPQNLSITEPQTFSITVEDEEITDLSNETVREAMKQSISSILSGTFGGTIRTARESSKMVTVYTITETEGFNICHFYISTGPSIYSGQIFINDVDESDAEEIESAMLEWLDRIGRDTPKEKPVEKKKKASSTAFSRATPDDELYPYYSDMMLGESNIQRAFGLSIPANGNGTDYSLVPLVDAIFNYLEDDDERDEREDLCEGIADEDTGNYHLHEIAAKMSRLFRVDKAIRSVSDDREAELDWGHIKRAYMLSGLRSFAWTLADHCEKNNLSPEDVDAAVVFDLVKYIANRKWLNFNEKGRCKGLCAGRDQDVIFVPDAASRSDRNKLAEMSGSELRSLDALRADLAYIHPAVLALWRKLRKTRDTAKPLTGNEADIVYAWCALARAAEKPFRLEQGTGSYMFDPEDDSQPMPEWDDPSLGSLVSPDNQFDFDELIHKMEKTQKDLAQAQEVIDKYSDILEKQEAEKAAEENKKKREQEQARAAGKSKADTVNMFVILTNESKTGRLHRSQEEFWEIYAETFPAFTKEELLLFREKMYTEMADEALRENYMMSFKKRSVKERFDIVTLNLKKTCDGTLFGYDFDKEAEYAIENTKEWFIPDEYQQVHQLMEQSLSDTRNDIDDQLRQVDPSWTDFSTAKDFLHITIDASPADEKQIEADYSDFQIVQDGWLLVVRLDTGGMANLYVNVMNWFAWYWHVSKLEIWETAYLNELRDSREDTTNGELLADSAFAQVKKRYSEKVALLHREDDNQAITEGDDSDKVIANQKQNKEEKKMKQLVCELCGGTDIIKQDGVFICQDCGCKYSIEEARKMMHGGTKEAAPANQDNEVVKNRELINNYMELANHAEDAGNSGEAENYCNKALEIDPKNHKAWMLKGKVAAWQSSLSNPRISEGINAFAKAINYAPDAEQPQILEDAIAQIVGLSVGMAKLQGERFAKWPDDEEAQGCIDVVTGILKSAQSFIGQTKKERGFGRMCGRVSVLEERPGCPNSIA